MIVTPLENGIVLDHIKPGRGIELYNILKLGDLDCNVALILNAKSEKMGKKPHKNCLPYEYSIPIIALII